ncbi:phage tail protein [Paracoccaceae bacterium GXU_MW_L88]
MANLTEQSLWFDEIYRIETTDPVVGGEPDLEAGLGISNIQALQLACRTAFLKQMVEMASPAGALITFAGTEPPSGWLECDGSQIRRDTYAKLFAAIGTIFGDGDGETTFAVPDLRGQFVRGWDHGRGVDNARAMGSEQGDTIRNIKGQVDVRGHGADSLFGRNNPIMTGAFLRHIGDVSYVQSSGNIGAGVESFEFDASRVVPTSNENRPKNTALMFCIKY